MHLTQKKQTQKLAIAKTNKTTKPDLVAFYDIRPGICGRANCTLCTCSTLLVSYVITDIFQQSVTVLV